MTQVREMPFSSARATPAVVLQTWGRFVEEITVVPELHALECAVEAVVWEQYASENYAGAVFWMSYGGFDSALGQFGEVLVNVGRAVERWKQAASWLQGQGEQGKERVYQPLYRQVEQQCQRLASLAEQVRLQVVVSCQQWNVAVPAWCVVS